MTVAYESASDWNRLHGTLVHVALRDGSALEARTRSYAQQWGAPAVIALDGHLALFTAAALQLVRERGISDTASP